MYSGCSHIVSFVALLHTLFPSILCYSAEKDSVHVSKLQGTSMFKDARSEAEEQIYKQINTKIDEFFELASYDWMMHEPKTHASGYIIDLIAFLRATFLSFTNLPVSNSQHYGVPDRTHSYHHTALSEISNRIVGKIILCTI